MPLRKVEELMVLLSGVAALRDGDGAGESTFLRSLVRPYQYVACGRRRHNPKSRRVARRQRGAPAFALIERRTEPGAAADGRREGGLANRRRLYIHLNGQVVAVTT